jgi:hypothetical protein
MLSVKESRRFVGDGPISLVALSKLEHREFPVSVRDVITVESRDFSGRITAGDVSAEHKMTIFNTGDWIVSAKLHDDGDIAGDTFVLDFILKGTDGVGARLEGELDADEVKEFGKSGNDPFIRNNWNLVSNNGMTTKLTVDPDIGGVIGGIVTALVIGLAVVFFASPGRTEARRCPDQPFDDHQPCVEFHKVGE